METGSAPGWENLESFLKIGAACKVREEKADSYTGAIALLVGKTVMPEIF